jgi:hypothetical protein
MKPRFDDRGWHLDVLNLPSVGKIGALNAGDAVARYGSRVYIDADINVTPPLLRQLAAVLGRQEPVFASGKLHIPPARSSISDRYGRFWLRLPFVSDGVPGCGLFAVNATGRARWGLFPDIISDDTFVRYHFSPDEMVGVDAVYGWPVTEGFASLVRVRRRQNEGVDEIHQRYPELAANVPSSKPSPRRLWNLFSKDPGGFAIYTAVIMAVRLPVFRNRGRWDRGR